jgi:hypothetical protein
MAQRGRQAHRNAVGTTLTRRCPDKDILGRYLFNIKANGPGQGLRPFRVLDVIEDDGATEGRRIRDGLFPLRDPAAADDGDADSREE